MKTEPQKAARLSVVNFFFVGLSGEGADKVPLVWLVRIYAVQSPLSGTVWCGRPNTGGNVGTKSYH